MIKILHTADLHLGAKVGWLGKKAEQYRQDMLETFSRIVDKAIEKKIDIFLVAGDLFDSPSPSPLVIAFVKKEIDRLVQEKIFVVILPGNHDRYEVGSVFERESIVKQPAGYVFHKEAVEIIPIESLNLEIYGSAVTKQFSNKSPLTPIIETSSKRPNNKFKVALVHGSVSFGNIQTNNFPIEIEEIKNSGMNYIALGDWHNELNATQGNVVAWYPGSPEPIASDQEKSGKAIYIEIGETGTKVEPIQIGLKKIRNIHIEMQKIYKDIENQEDKNINVFDKVLEISEKDANPNEIRYIVVEGRRKISNKINIQELIKQLESKFYYINIKDKTEIEITKEELEMFPEELLVGRFIRTVMKDLKNETNADKKRILEEVIQEGVNRLMS